MSKFLILFLACFNLSFSQELSIHQLAIEHIKNSEDFKSFTNGQTNKIQVMPEVIPFSDIGFGYFDEVLEQTGTDYSNGQNSEPVVEDKSLEVLSEKKKSKLKLWFSPTSSNVLMAELAIARSKNDYYHDGITNFGLTLVFYMRFENGELAGIKASERHNN
ncbi:MAG: hypothetical protein JXQ96_21790 [Cyclobacteriaceae bacterium]